ncbi:hypothetical protein HanPI659440_Chr11g0431851 [Helianthus annuus]|nr:hypothetical protein HanPI659440_Chr11g0431851 [Helianthus annuus]
MNDNRPYGSSRTKRKDRESSLFPPAKRPPPPPPRATVNTSRTTTAATKPTTEMNMMTSSNKLLAGYMAYEFLTSGTVLGHKFGTDRSETTAFSGNERYEQITSLLMVKTEGGDQISGVVNPTELRRWIEM